MHLISAHMQEAISTTTFRDTPSHSTVEDISLHKTPEQIFDKEVTSIPLLFQGSLVLEGPLLELF